MFKIFVSTALAAVISLSVGFAKAADQVVIGMSMVKTWFLKTPG